MFVQIPPAPAKVAVTTYMYMTYNECTLSIDNYNSK